MLPPAHASRSVRLQGGALGVRLSPDLGVVAHHPAFAHLDRCRRPAGPGAPTGRRRAPRWSPPARQRARCPPWRPARAGTARGALRGAAATRHRPASAASCASDHQPDRGELEGEPAVEQAQRQLVRVDQGRLAREVCLRHPRRQTGSGAADAGSSDRTPGRPAATTSPRRGSRRRPKAAAAQRPPARRPARGGRGHGCRNPLRHGATGRRRPAPRGPSTGTAGRSRARWPRPPRGCRRRRASCPAAAPERRAPSPVSPGDIRT